MKGAKYILTAAVIAMSSVMMTGCFKPSKDAVVESKYYQSLKDERDKLSVQLKEEKKKTNSLNKKIKAIHATSGDQESELCGNEYSCLQICKDDCNWM